MVALGEVAGPRPHVAHQKSLLLMTAYSRYLSIGCCRAKIALELFVDEMVEVFY